MQLTDIPSAVEKLAPKEWSSLAPWLLTLLLTSWALAMQWLARERKREAAASSKVLSETNEKFLQALREHAADRKQADERWDKERDRVRAEHREERAKDHERHAQERLQDAQRHEAAFRKQQEYFDSSLKQQREWHDSALREIVQGPPRKAGRGG